MSGPPNYMTPRGYERIRLELQWLEKEERPRVVAEVSYAAAMGDRSENAEYIYGKKRLREIDGRRRYLLKRLSRTQLVDPATQKPDVIRFGATVVIVDEGGNERTWKIYGEDEVDIARGVLSWKAPIARAMMGKQDGDDFSFKAPGGTRHYEIISFRYEPLEPLTEQELDFSR